LLSPFAFLKLPNYIIVMRISAMILRFAGVLFCWLLLGLGVSAQDAPLFDSQAKQAILIDAKSGIVFYEKDADTSIPPASMSKLITQAIVFDALKKGDLKIDQEMVVSEDAWRRGGASAGGSTMYAELNSRVKIDDLIHGAIIQSANDACIVLAEGMAGSEQAFTQRMAFKAKELGLKNSSFANATGLPDPAHRMSVRDLSIVARYIITNHPDYFKIYSQPEFTWNKITQQNRNPLLKEYPGADGMKTGYTKEAGYGMVGSATRDGRRLILVVAGLNSINERKIEAQKLLDWGFNQFKTVNLYEAGETVARARVWGGTERWVNLIISDAFKVALSPQEQTKAEVKLTYSGPLIAPVKAGQAIGTVRILIDGKAVADASLVAAGDISATDSMWKKALDSALIMVFGG
jgi:serine-type D-Ala-D-Ala carboxypeptidase (penicillin-binding protein 5/6)